MKSTSTFLLLLFITAGFFLTACNDEDPFSVDYSLVPDPYPIENAEKVTLEDGLEYYRIKEGSGDLEVNVRDVVKIWYTKRDENNKIISSSYANKQPLSVTGIVSGSPNIFAEEGFRKGVIGMKEGEIRVIIVPPNMHNYSTLSDESVRIDVELDEITY